MAFSQRAVPHWFNAGYLRARALLARRFSLAAVLCLLLCLTALGTFGLIADSVEDHRRLTAFDEKLAATMTQEASPRLLAFFRLITRLGSVPMMSAVAILGGLAMAVRRQLLLSLSVVFTALGGGLLDEGLKVIFQRTRPPFPDVAVTERNWSFPSGHSMGSVIGYGMVAYLLILLIVRKRWAQVAVVASLALVVILIGCSRIYLRAHYFSDVIAGYTVGTAWLVLCISCTEWLRRRRGISQPTTVVEKGLGSVANHCSADPRTGPVSEETGSAPQ